MKVSKAIINVLEWAGIKRAFGIPGVHNLPFYDVLKNSTIKHTLVRHEQAAPFIADAIFRTTRELSLVVTTTGPGAANTLSALLEPMAKTIPVIVLTSQITREKWNWPQSGLHQVKDQLGSFVSCTKERFCVKEGGDALGMTIDAIKIALTPPMGPVAIEVPFDVWDNEVCLGELPDFSRFLERPEPDLGEVEHALKIIRSWNKPLILLGGGILHSGAEDGARELVELLKAGVLCTPSAKGIIPYDHELFLGNINGGSVMAEVLNKADGIMVIGARFSEESMRFYKLNLPESLVHIDANRKRFGPIYTCKASICSDIKEALKALTKELKTFMPKFDGKFHRQNEAKVSTYADKLLSEHKEFSIINDLRKILGKDAIIVADQTMLGYWADNFLPSYKPRTLFQGTGSGTLGYALPAAIGAKMANPEVPVLAILGDAGLLFTVQEMATAIQESTNICVFLLNNEGYGVLRYYQSEFYSGPTEADLVAPDFTSLAKAFGWNAKEINDFKDFEAIYRELEGQNKPFMIILNERILAVPFMV